MSEKDIKFEDALKALQECADKLKSGELSLDESIEVYDKSIMYYNRCKEILEGVRQRIELYDPSTKEREDFEL